MTNDTALQIIPKIIKELKKYNDKRYQNSASVTGGNFSFTIGTSAPADHSLWLDTSNYLGGAH